MAKKLLLADDSITIQKVVSLTFAEEDYDVICVGNGEIAIEKIKELQPDVVLADIFMPRQTGYEVCEFVKTNAGLVHIPVLLLVGTFEPFDKQEAARVGADGYLTKPFETTVLVQMVNDAVDKAGKQAGMAAPQPAAGTPRPSPEPTLQMPAGEGTGRSVGAPPPGHTDEDILETPDFPGGDKMSGAFDATIISSAPAGAGEDLGPEEILLGDDEVAVPPSALREEDEYAPPPDQPVAAVRSFPPAGTDEEILEIPAMDARITRPTEEDILGVFDLIHLDDIIARQKSLEESVSEEPAADVAEAPEQELPAEEEPAVQWESMEMEAPAAGAGEESEEALEIGIMEEEESEIESALADTPVAEPERASAEPVRATAQGAVLDEQLVTRIAEMVVERLSERIIREIAWEVVPDLAELLIRQEIDNMKEEGKI